MCYIFMSYGCYIFFNCLFCRTLKHVKVTMHISLLPQNNSLANTFKESGIAFKKKMICSVPWQYRQWDHFHNLLRYPRHFKLVWEMYGIPNSNRANLSWNIIPKSILSILQSWQCIRCQTASYISNNMMELYDTLYVMDRFVESFNWNI